MSQFIIKNELQIIKTIQRDYEMDENIDANYKNVQKIGLTAADSFNDIIKSVPSWIIITNGGGLIATLAFIGSTLSSNNKAIFFYHSTIFFGIGLVAAFLFILCNAGYFYLAVKKYKTNVLERDPLELSYQLSDPQQPLLVLMANPTQGQKIFSILALIFISLSFIFFMMGIVYGFIDLGLIRLAILSR